QQFRRSPPGQPHAPAVHRVADDGIADVGHVDTDLVRAPGFQTALHEGVAAETFLDAVMGDRLAGIGSAADRTFLAVGRVPADRRIHRTAGSQHALHDGIVTAADAALL